MPKCLSSKWGWIFSRWHCMSYEQLQVSANLKIIHGLGRSFPKPKFSQEFRWYRMMDFLESIPTQHHEPGFLYTQHQLILLSFPIWVLLHAQRAWKTPASILHLKLNIKTRTSGGCLDAFETVIKGCNNSNTIRDRQSTTHYFVLKSHSVSHKHS